MIQYQGLLHASILVEDLQKTLHFYCDILGMQVDPSRPDLGYPGAWLKIGEEQIHILNLPNPDPTENRPSHGGRDRHTAIAVGRIDDLVLQLEKHGVSFTRSKSGRAAIFCRDPDGNALEFIQAG